MKTRMILLILMVLFTSCDLIIIEPVYDVRDSITGNYQIEEFSQTYNDYVRYHIYIRKSGVYDEIIIANFYNAGLNVRAGVMYDKIYISKQILNGYEIEGVGTIYDGEIQFSYRVRDIYAYTRPTDFCNATAWFK